MLLRPLLATGLIKKALELRQPMECILRVRQVLPPIFELKGTTEKLTIYTVTRNLGVGQHWRE
jgi:hypothetical protein